MKHYKILLNKKEIEINTSTPFGRDILSIAGLKPVECYTLYQKLKGCDFEKISLDETVDLSNPGIEEFVTKEPEVFNYTVDGEPETTDKKQLTPVEIMKLAGVDSDKYYLIQVLDNSESFDYAYSPNQPIKMVCTGMNFKTAPWLDMVDIEEWGKECKAIPPSRKYRIKIDKDYYVVDKLQFTGLELLSIAGKNPPDKFDIFKMLNGQPKPIKIGHNDHILLNEKCLVRFVTLPKEQTDGEGLRKQFTLPVDDIAALDNMGLLWETLVQNNRWLIIYDYPIPNGYNVDKSDLALLIPPMYDTVEIDMAYFYPHLQKQSNRPIKAITGQSIDNKLFQRWSRHRQPGQWRPGVDNVTTHLTLVDNWLLNDLNR